MSFCQFFQQQKSCMKLRKIWAVGGICPLPRSATDYIYMSCFIYFFYEGNFNTLKWISQYKCLCNANVTADDVVSWLTLLTCSKDKVQCNIASTKKKKKVDLPASVSQWGVRVCIEACDHVQFALRGTVRICYVYSCLKYITIMSSNLGEYCRKCSYLNLSDLLSLSEALRIHVPGSDRSRISHTGEGGGINPQFRAKTYYLARFLSKTAWKWKKLEQERAHPCPSAQICQWYRLGFMCKFTDINILIYIFTQYLYNHANKTSKKSVHLLRSI